MPATLSAPRAACSRRKAPCAATKAPETLRYVVIFEGRLLHRCESAGEAVAFARGYGEGEVFVRSKYQAEKIAE